MFLNKNNITKITYKADNKQIKGAYFFVFIFFKVKFYFFDINQSEI